MIRSRFAGWSDATDRVLATLTDEDLAPSPFPHYRHPIPRVWGRGPVTLLGDAAHTMPPTLAQGTNQALLDTMMLRRAVGSGPDLPAALRSYERSRGRRVALVSWLTSLQVSHAESDVATGRARAGRGDDVGAVDLPARRQPSPDRRTESRRARLTTR